MRAAIYARVSTTEQAKEGYSIDAQRSRLIDFVNSQGWEIADIYIDDGFSAKDLNRPKMQRMMHDMTKKHFDVVLVYKLDRLVRSVTDLHNLLQLFDKYDVKFKSATESFETTSAMGRFFITLVGAMAQWERENLAERVKMGMEQKVLKGERNGSYAPFGYQLTDGQLFIDPKEAPIVRRIFELYKTKGLNHTARILNKEGLLGRRRKQWATFTIQYVIDNPVYCGKLRWNKDSRSEEIITEGSHEKIISEKEFEEIQRIRKSRSSYGKRVTSAYPFSTVLRCARCGSTFLGTHRRRKSGALYKYYRCSGRFYHRNCDMPIVAEWKVTEAFLERAKWKIDEQTKKELQVEKEEPVYSDRDALEEELKVIAKRKRKWQEAFANDAIDVEQLRANMAQEKEKEQRIMELLTEQPQETVEWNEDELLQHLQDIKSVWSDIDDYSRKQFVNEIFESISIDTKSKGLLGPRDIGVDIVNFTLR
ncbi:recombinase family protein [Aneurinibacillus aneurinilyticus]|uniref:Resolvase protein n=1 Tax=Aneurinibacillus aneurinilyticus ATCC 12856 TaxID=649747 RepID=U1WMG0_ANEAE|nr:recombinase family protein [Aneurinibacillus aneurinilyticus]ERI09759.1 resolvase protein [Aneurinibacillus aneurinilyticus ATCC 12856]MED0707117.1 recombinase family protein [Aneurinibacillus aneurinilyticus]MED0732814.1 recombinase family protein [Aneurinibacillus aneurinilyticus]MED0740416.1 recombinase family protein [Aneurinibacillus aneurinilyticus]